MKIAVDAMGGDHAPREVVLGALAVAREDPETTIVLVGDEREMNAILASEDSVPDTLLFHPASETIAMGEHPVSAIRKKRDSSLVVAGQMVKTGAADATFSAGNTGAAMAFGTLEIGRIPGIERPAIATWLPTMVGRALLLDLGANPDCTPENLLQFALLGSVYVERTSGKTKPTVGLLNIGSEPGKGNELSKTAYTLLQNGPFEFYGNVEGKDVFEGTTDVVVCDAFAGNVLLKAAEGIAELMLTELQGELTAASEGSPVRSVLGPALRRLMQRVDYAETGGAVLLGVNGVSVIGHGRSHAKAIASGIRLARDAAASGYLAGIREALGECAT